MKKVQNCFIIFLAVILISSCVAEKAIPLENSKQIDTIITFDPVTFEETIYIVESDENSLEPNIVENYRI